MDMQNEINYAKDIKVENSQLPFDIFQQKHDVNGSSAGSDGSGKLPHHELQVKMFDTTKLVRLQLIHENWKFIESRKSPLISTLPQLSRKSLVPPTLSRFENEDRTEHNREFDKTTSEHADVQQRLKRISRKAWIDDDDDVITGRSRLTDPTKRYRDSVDNDFVDGEAGVRVDRLNGLSPDSGSEWIESKTAPSLVHSQHRPSARPAELKRGELRGQYNDPSNTTDNFSDEYNEYDEDENEMLEEVLPSVTNRKLQQKQLPGSINDSSKHLNGVSATHDVTDIDVDTLCVTPRVDEDNVTLLPRWPLHEAVKPGVHVIPSYENLVSLHRDSNRPLFMYIPEPIEHGKPSVGDVDVSELSDLSDPEEVASDDDHENSKTIQRMDSCVQTEILPTTASEKHTLQQQQQTDDLATQLNSTFEAKPANVSVTEGDVAEITCQLTGPEPHDIYWFRDTTDLINLEDDERCVSSRQGSTFKVLIYNTTRKDSGYYLCVAANGLGQSTHRFLVVVKAGDKSVKKRAPSFSHPLLKSMSIAAGQTAELRCHVTGTPVPLVLWFIDGQRIKDGGSDFALDCSTSGRHGLTILSTGSHVGEKKITVVARNAAGEVSSTTAVHFLPDGSHTVVPESVAQKNEVRSDAELYPDSEQLMRIAELAAAAAKSKPGKVNEARHHSLLNFSRSVDLPELLKPEPTVTTERLPSVISPPAAFLDPYIGSEQQLPESDDMVDLELTYHQFKALYDAGIISSAEMDHGRVSRSDLHAINTFLEQHQLKTESHLPKDVSSADDSDAAMLTIDCGLKRVDSKRYGRDYIINRSQSTTANLEQVNSLSSRQQSVGEMARSQQISSENSSAVVDDAEPQYVTSQQTEVNVQECVRDGDNFSSPNHNEQLPLTANSSTNCDERIAIIESANEPNDQSANRPIDQSPSVLAVDRQDINNNTKLEVSVEMRRKHSTKADDEGSAVVFPSVKRLSSQFDEQVKKTNDENTFRRVYSLTGRDLPKSVREKMQKPHKSLFDSTKSTTPPQRGRIQSETTARTCNGNKMVNKPTIPERSMSSSDDIRPTTTSARTLFWQTRIMSGKTSDDGDVINAFPQLPSDIFKKSDV